MRAVGLDDEPLLRPAEVGDDAPPVDEQRHIDERMREAGAQDQVEHDVLELALGWGGAGGDDGRQLAPAADRAWSVQHCGERPNRRELEELRLTDRTA